jgi:hypothetical protein
MRYIISFWTALLLMGFTKYSQAMGYILTHIKILFDSIPMRSTHYHSKMYSNTTHKSKHTIPVISQPCNCGNSVDSVCTAK